MYKSGKILIIEDEPSIADNIGCALTMENFIPLWVSTAGEGSKVLENEDIALIILDIGLPDTSGTEFCKQLRRTSSVPIIFLTARASEVDKIVGLEIGADDYMTKPFSPRELVARVRAILRRSARISNDDSVSAHGALSIDQEKNRISYFNAPLSLSRYEYKILELLILHPGRVFSRKQLMNSVWEEPESSTERTVDTHIKTIRTKLNAIREGREAIITHRGFGYSLAELS